jgi:SAM-dependent methyltransferase
MNRLLSRLMKTLHDPVYRSRLQELTQCILRHLKPGDRILDVGCGNGALGGALMAAFDRPTGLSVEGLERFARGGEPIPVRAYDGNMIPAADDSFDAVILADVLHHEQDPDHLLRECARVSRRLLLIKDHQIKGLLAHPRIKLLDWAANSPYGMPCLFRYNTPAEWAKIPDRLSMDTVLTIPSMRLYPFPYSIVFGGDLQYFTVLRKRAPHSNAVRMTSA